MPGEARVGELLNMFYLREKPKNIAYSYTTPSKITLSVGTHCSDHQILARSIAGFPAILEELRMACDKASKGYDLSVAFPLEKSRFCSLNIKQAAMRPDMSVERVGRVPKRLVEYSRTYDWHTCSCILPSVELEVFNKALRILLDAKTPIKISSDLSINPGEWSYPYGSRDLTAILVNMGDKRSMNQILSSLFSSRFFTDIQSMGDTNSLTEQPFFSAYLDAQPSFQEYSPVQTDNVLIASMLNTYTIGTFLAQPLQGNLDLCVNSFILQRKDSIKQRSASCNDEPHQQDEEELFCTSALLDDSTYSKQTPQINSVLRDVTSFGDSSDYLNNPVLNDKCIEYDGADFSTGLVPKNIHTLRSITSDGIQVLGEYLKNERLWKQQTAALLSKHVVSSIENKTRQRSYLKLTPKPEALIVEQFWSTVGKSLEAHDEEDSDHEEIFWAHTNTSPGSRCLRLQEEGIHNSKKELDDTAIELSDQALFADPQSPVHPFEASDLHQPRNIDKDSLYYTEDPFLQREDQAPEPLSSSYQLNTIDNAQTQQQRLMYQTLRQEFKILNAEVSISLDLLQLLLTNILCNFLSIQQLLDIGTASCWIYTVIFTISLGRIKSVYICPQRGSSFLSYAGQRTRQQTFLALHTRYKPVPLDLSLSSVSHYAFRNLKTAQDSFKSRLEITLMAISRLLHLYPSTQYDLETHAVTQLFNLSDYISAKGLLLENRFFTMHSLRISDNNNTQTLTEVDILIRYLKEYLNDDSLVALEAFNADIIASGYYLMQNTKSSAKSIGNPGLTPLIFYDFPKSIISRSKISEQIAMSKSSSTLNLQTTRSAESFQLYDQLKIIFKDIWTRFIADSDTFPPRANVEVDTITLAPHIYHQPNVRYLLSYQTQMLLSLSASYSTGNKSFILRVPRKTGALRFVTATFLSKLCFLKRIRDSHMGECTDAKPNPAMSVVPEPTVARKDYSPTAVDRSINTQQVHLVFCEEDKVEGFLSMYVRLIFGMRVYNAISHEIFGSDTDKLLFYLKNRKAPQKQGHQDESQSVAHECPTRASTAFYPSTIPVINFTDLLSQKMLLDDLACSLSLSIFSCESHKNSVAVAEITKNTEFSSIQPQRSPYNIFKCIDANLYDSSSLSLTTHADNGEASGRSALLNQKLSSNLPLLTIKESGVDHSIKCASYIIGSEMENQKAISVPSRLLFNLFDQSNGSRQNLKHTDLPVSIRLCIVTYDALHYNYKYTHGQILSLLKKTGHLDTLIVHRIKDHAPHLPLHLYKPDFFISIESAYILNRTDDLRQEGETRKKLLHLQSIFSSHTVGQGLPQKALFSHDGHCSGSTGNSSVHSYDKTPKIACAGELAAQLEQNEFSIFSIDKQSEQSEQSSIGADVTSMRSSNALAPPEETQAHFLFYDLVALNYERCATLLANIYDLKLLGGVLTNPTIALLYLEALNKTSCSIYLQNIHSYGSQGTHKCPNFHVLTRIAPHGKVNPLPPEFSAIFPIYNSVKDPYKLPLLSATTRSRSSRTSAQITAFSGSSRSSSLRNSTSQLGGYKQALPQDTIKLVRKFALFDVFINELNVAYNALLTQNPGAKSQQIEQQKMHSNKFWVYAGLYMNTVMITTTMHSNSLDSVASVLTRSYNFAFGRNANINWLIEKWDDFPINKSSHGAYNALLSYGKLHDLKSVHAPTAPKSKTLVGLAGDATIIADVRRSLPENYLYSMQTNLRQIQSLWVNTDGRLILISPEKLQAQSKASGASQCEWMLAHNASLSLNIYNKIFLRAQDTDYDNFPLDSRNNKKLYFVSAAGDLKQHVSRSVAYQTRTIPLLIAIELLDSLKQFLHKTRPRSEHSAHQAMASQPQQNLSVINCTSARTSNDVNNESNAPLKLLLSPIDALKERLKAKINRVVGLATMQAIITPEICGWSHAPAAYSMRHSVQIVSALAPSPDNEPNLPAFSLLNIAYLATVLPQTNVSSRYSGTYNSDLVKLHSDLTLPANSKGPIAKIRGKLSYSTTLNNKSLYIFKIPFKTYVQPKYFNLLRKRPLLSYFSKIDQQNVHNINENFINKVHFSALCACIETSNSTILNYIKSIIYFQRLFIITNGRRGLNKQFDSHFIITFPFACSFFSHVTLNTIGTAFVTNDSMFETFSCLLPLSSAHEGTDKKLTYSFTYENMLANSFAVASSSMRNVDFNLIVTGFQRRKVSTSIRDPSMSLLSIFLDEIESLEKGLSSKVTLSLLQSYGKACCSLYCIPPIMYKILANSTETILTVVSTVLALWNKKQYTLNTIYNETPILVSVSFAIRRLLIEFNFCGKRQKPMIDIISQSDYRQNIARSYSFDRQNILCPTSLEKLNSITPIPAMLGTAQSISDINSNSPQPCENSCDSNRFKIRYTNDSNQSSDDQKNNSQCQRSIARNDFRTEYELSSILSKRSAMKDSTQMSATQVLYVSALEPPRKQKLHSRTISKADELTKYTMSMRSEISAVDAAERANEQSENSDELSDSMYTSQMHYNMQPPTHIFYAREDRPSTLPMGILQNLSISGDMNTETKINKPYALYHDNSDDMEHEIDDVFIKNNGFDFILILANSFETLQMLGTILHFSLGGCKANIIVPNENEVLTYISASNSTTVTTVGRRHTGAGDGSENTMSTRKGTTNKRSGAASASAKENVVRNLADEGEKCIVLQTLTDFLAGIELFVDARRIHLFIMPCIPSLLVMEAINRANLNSVIICWSNPSVRGILDQILQKDTLSAIVKERLEETADFSQKLITSLPEELQYIVLNQAKNKSLQQLLLATIGLIKESGYNVSNFFLFDDDIGKFRPPKLESSIEQESLSTESYNETGKYPAADMQSKYEFDVLECGSQASVDFPYKTDHNIELYSPHGVKRNEKRMGIFRRCIRHCLYERFKSDFDVGKDAEQLDLRSTYESMFPLYPDLPDSQLLLKTSVQSEGPDLLQESLEVLSTVKHAYAQLSLLHTDKYSLDLTCCPLEIVKLLSHVVFLSIYNRRSQVETFASSLHLGKLNSLTGHIMSKLSLMNFVGEPLLNKITSLICIDTQPPPRTALVPTEVKETTHFPSIVDLLKIESFPPSRAYYYDEYSSVRSITSNQSTNDYSMVNNRGCFNLITSTPITLHVAHNNECMQTELETLSKQHKQTNRSILISSQSSSNTSQISDVRPYKRVSLLAQLGDELKRLFSSQLAPLGDLCFLAEFHTSQPVHIAVSPIMLAPAYKRKLIPFCERQLPYEDLHPSDLNTSKNQLGVDKNMVYFNPFLWNRQLVANILSIYHPYESLLKTTQSRAKLDECTPSSNTPQNQILQLMRMAMVSIHFSVHESFTYKKLLSISICECLINKYNELNRLLRIRASSGYSSENVMTMIKTWQSNVDGLYQTLEATSPYFTLSASDKKVILYVLCPTDLHAPEMCEVGLNANIQDQYVPKLAPGLMKKEEALKYILSQKWGKNLSSNLADNLKDRLVERIEELTATKGDTVETKRSLIQLLLYNLDYTRIVGGITESLVSNCSRVQHAESTANLVISNFSCNNYKKQQSCALSKECSLDLSYNRCVTVTQSGGIHTTPLEKIPQWPRPPQLCSVVGHFSSIYKPLDPYTQRWKPLW